MTELSVVHDPHPLPEGVRHIPGAPLPRPAVLLKAVIANTEQYWYVYERDDDTADSVATRVAKTQRHINWLREKFGGDPVSLDRRPGPALGSIQGQAQHGTGVVSTPPTETPTPTRETHECAWHGPMRESTKAPGTWYCSKKKSDGSWCPSKWPVRAGEKVS